MSLTNKFFVTIVGSMITLVLVLGSLVSTSVASYVMSRNSDSTALYMESFLEPHVQSMAGDGVLSSEDLAALEAISQDEALRRHVLSIKVWAPSGRIAFATDPELIGQEFPTDELLGPLSGKIETYLDELEDDENEFERKFTTPIFEVYVPLRSTVDGSIIAVGEFYEDATKLQTYLANSAKDNWALLGAAAVTFLGALYLIFSQGNQTILNQTAQINRLKAEKDRIRAESEKLHTQMQEAKQKLGDLDEIVRRRVGQELHDGPAQLLSYLMLNLDDLIKIQQVDHSDPSRFDDIQLAAERAQTAIREMSSQLVAAEAADKKESTISLDKVIEDYTAMSHVEVDARGTKLVGMLHPKKQRAIARIVNEALNNGFKHAGGVGQSVDVSVKSGDLVIVVSDRGPGFPDIPSVAENESQGHLGLGSMRDQAESIGARLDIGLSAAQTTDVTVTLPIS